ncbi:hypothetical protein DSC45_03820 [Streptomyces sp. YIM 130001]|uniref:hypothetical protein n=1 Tax=Streptomyces sp. YIM 130001 TaxID=2259644 RepID=UPI000E65946D|nr:hypothetical protein [Streptomyces sp. YIM 130001]RII20330.1 hypothetical protein DSC45_03820 [Streptomyces sp. YIM 130001]
MTHAPVPRPAAVTSRRARRGSLRHFALGTAGASLVAVALTGCSSGEDSDAGESPVRTEPPRASDSPVAHVPATDETGKQLKAFYAKYLAALDGPSGEPGKLRKERLSTHYLEDLGGDETLNRGDALTQSENTPHRAGKVSHDSTIDNHSWFFVDLEWKDGKVPTEESGTPDEPEYSPTQLRVQVDRDSQKISDVDVRKREPGPGQPDEPRS